MSNIQHSSRTDEWNTPKYIVDMVHEVLGNIDLDPASSPLANNTIKASKYFTSADDALTKVWADVPVTIYLNPPGGKSGNKSMTAIFWEKLMDLHKGGLLEHAIVMGFSLEHLAVTQGCSIPMCEFPICIPRKRIRFISPLGDFNSPTHSNVIVYVPGVTNNTSIFKEVFSRIGCLMHPS